MSFSYSLTPLTPFDDVLRGDVGPKDKGFEQVSIREDEEAEKSSV